jgi:putative flippase GtrA
VETLKSHGLALCILSNTRRVERLARVAGKLGVDFLRGRFKPSAKMYHQALKRYAVQPDEAVMIGDQLFTDVWGANRAGIEAVWVKPMARREFLGTKLSRLGEWIVRGTLYKTMEKLTEPQELPQDRVSDAANTLPARPVIRQFLKFCVVGGGSFVIDYCIRMTLLFAIPWGPVTMGDAFGGWLRSSLPAIFSYADKNTSAAMPIFATLSASVAILNSFFWNRSWTFRIRGKEEAIPQLRRFVVVSVIGLGLNVLLSTAFHSMIPGPEKTSARWATVLAAVIVAVWNFAGQRLYAFRLGRK